MEHQTTEDMLGLAEFKTTKNSSSVPLSPLSGDSKIIDLKLKYIYLENRHNFDLIIKFSLRKVIVYSSHTSGLIKW